MSECSWSIPWGRSEKALKFGDDIRTLTILGHPTLIIGWHGCGRDNLWFGLERDASITPVKTVYTLSPVTLVDEKNNLVSLVSQILCKISHHCSQYTKPNNSCIV